MFYSTTNNITGTATSLLTITNTARGVSGSGSPTRQSSRESVVVGGITATIFLLCCLTIALTLNLSKDVDKRKFSR